MKFYLGETEPGDDSEDDDPELEHVNRLVEFIVEESDLPGYWKFPKDKKRTMEIVSERVFRQEPRYGTGENRLNGFDANYDRACLAKFSEVVLGAFEDDGSRPSVRMQVETVERGFIRKRKMFIAKIWVARRDLNGNFCGYSGPYETDPRPRQAELIPLIADLLDTEVPVRFDAEK